MTVTIGINGFGRIGRCALKHSLDRDDLETALAELRRYAEAVERR